MKKLFKKFATAAIAASMVLVSMAPAMTAQSFAANNDGTTLKIAKSLVVANDGLSTVAGPGLTYNFTVSNPAISGVTVNNVSVKTGPADGLTVSAQPTFAVSDALNCSSFGTSNVDDIELSVDLEVLDAAGIYRYKLTDSTTQSAIEDAAVVRSSSYDPTRWVDVYVENDSNGDPVVAGYVVFNTQDQDPSGNNYVDPATDNGGNYGYDKQDFTKSSEDGEDDPSKNPPGSAVNTEGNGDGAGNADPSIAADADGAFAEDLFTTYNIAVTNVSSGNLADRLHNYPLAATLSLNNNRQVMMGKGNDLAAYSAFPTGVTMKHGDVYEIRGLSALDTVTWTETNTTQDTYSVAVSGNGGAVAASDVAPAGTKDSGSIAMDALSDDGLTTFTFTLDTVSPTGILMRFGAPLLVLIAGIALVIMNRKAKHSVK